MLDLKFVRSLRHLSASLRTRHSQIPLLWVIVVPFVLQTTTVVGLTAYFSIRQGQQSIDQLATQIRHDASDRVNQHLRTYLAIPPHVVQSTYHAWSLNLFDPNDFSLIGRFFRQKIETYNIGYLLFGHASGRLIASGHAFDTRTTHMTPLIAIDEGKPGPNQSTLLKTWQANVKGDRMQVIQDWMPYAMKQEGWYSEAAKQGHSTWSPIYQWGVQPYPLAIAYSRPVYTANHRLFGVFAVEQPLSRINDFLKTLKVSPNGRVFILERNGLLIASSGAEALVSQGEGGAKRRAAIESADPLIQTTAKHLLDEFSDFRKIQGLQALDCRQHDNHAYVQVTPWKDDLGLDWLVVVVVPESDFYSEIQASHRMTWMLCAIALILTIAISGYTGRWIVRPILRLRSAAAAIAAGELNQTVSDSPIAELNELSQTFNQMALQLQQSFDTLAQTNSTLEQRVEERTAALSNTLNELQQTQAQLVQTAKMSSLGQLVAGIAHEVNNPVNFIHGNLRYVRGALNDLLAVVHLYQSHYPDPVPAVTAQADAIDLAFLMRDVPKLLDSMENGSTRIRNIVAGLRIFSRLDEKGCKAVDLHQGIESTLLVLKHRLCDRIQLVTDFDTLPDVECLAGAINQVLFNLLDNAIDALQPKLEDDSFSPTIRIETRLLRSHLENDDQVQIKIIDNGVGIAKHEQSKIFDPFFTTKMVGQGTGLGLAISYQIIVFQHRGILACTSTEGMGTEFRIEFPISTDACSVPSPTVLSPVEPDRLSQGISDRVGNNAGNNAGNNVGNDLSDGHCDDTKDHASDHSNNSITNSVCDRASVDEIVVDEIVVDEIVVDEIVVDEIVVDEIVVDEIVPLPLEKR